MQNFKSKDKAITIDTLFNGFKSVMLNTELSASVAAGKFASFEVSETMSIVVYEADSSSYIAEAVVTKGGRTLNVASAEFDQYDI